MVIYLHNHKVNSQQFSILLADDDIDDCKFFQNAVDELQLATRLNIVHNGEELMKHLNDNVDQLPDVLFLDLSMPRKTGFECLSEIKEDEFLKGLPVIVFTTSFTSGIDFEADLARILTKIGTEEYIRKPGNFEMLKQIITNVVVKIQNRIQT